MSEIRTLELTMNRHVDFAHALQTYVIYPWVRNGEALIRPLRVGPEDSTVVVAQLRQVSADRLKAQISGPELDDTGVGDVQQSLERALQLDYPYAAIDALTRDDPVLAAAVRHRGLGRGKLYPDLFEALCGVVCAQRTSFARVYGMMRKIAETFGQPTETTVENQRVHAFPTPSLLAAAAETQLRTCGVGFRSKGLGNVAASLAEQNYTWNTWRHREPADVVEDLLTIRGVGPYTANLAVNLSYGTGGAPHVDTYVTDVVGRLYLHDPKATPERVARYIEERWGALGERVLDYLTTDTEVWTAEIGKSVGVKSGARV
ncbi:DNA-3-methyladenine glycosylase family protein [Streptomyces sp. NPDC102381]|uniref:DNA-3-methyladenine glycosylase family protein n=1 Tax=Streptomyces sp. NPDC102381 TaxID=3366164 RepID=UPI003805F4CA